MKKTTLLLLLLFLLIGCAPQGIAIADIATEFPDLITIPSAILESSSTEIAPVITSPVKLAWFYKPPQDGTSLASLVEHFDFFILTHYDEEERDELRNLGSDAPILQYLLFVQIQDPGSCNEEPYGNQVAYKIGDFCTLLKEHPNWFLRDANGELIRKSKNVFMDPGNQEYREFWLERAQELQDEYGWNGIFIDNVEASRNKFERIGQAPAQYSSDSQYQAAVEEFLVYVSENIPEETPLYANIIEYNDSEIWLRYLKHLDGAMIEDFAVDYNERYYSASFWEEQINMAEQALEAGKSVIFVAQGEMENKERERFSLVSYLLVKSDTAYFRYTDSGYYEDVWLYENYLSLLGPATSTAYEIDGSWRRDFVSGYVILNPSSHYSEIVVE